jgi:hypothetical protein
MARIPGLAVEAEGVDFVPELDSVRRVDVACTQVPKMDPELRTTSKFCTGRNLAYLNIFDIVKTLILQYK